MFKDFVNQLFATADSNQQAQIVFCLCGFGCVEVLIKDRYCPIMVNGHNIMAHTIDGVKNLNPKGFSKWRYIEYGTERPADPVSLRPVRCVEIPEGSVAETVDSISKLNKVRSVDAKVTIDKS